MEIKNEEKGFIYILENPSFPQFIKIGFAHNVKERLAQLNRSECVPFAFTVYASYEVHGTIKDKVLHRLIDIINKDLRSKQDVDGHERIRDFYEMPAENAYLVLQSIANLSDTLDRLKKWNKTRSELEEVKEAEKSRERKRGNHFAKVRFHSSLTGKDYETGTTDDEKLKITDLSNNEEVPNNSDPSKKSIIKQALKDMHVPYEESHSTYQLANELIKVIKIRETNKLEIDVIDNKDTKKEKENSTHPSENTLEPIDENGDYSNTVPARLTFLKNSTKVSSYRELFLRFLKILYENKSQKINELVSSEYKTPNSKKPLISKNSALFLFPGEIEKTDLYVETKKDTNQLLKTIRVFLKLCDIDNNEFLFSFNGKK